MKKILYLCSFLCSYMGLYAQTCQNCGVNQSNPQASLHVKGCGFTNSTFGFKVSNSLNKTALFVHDDLKVGIGGKSNTYQLEVSDTATAAGIQTIMRIANRYVATANNGSQILFATNRSTSGMTNIAGIAGVMTDISSSAYKGALIFSTADNASPAERMRVDHLGNVGIGTTNPEDKLQVGTESEKFNAGSAKTPNLGYGTSYIGFNASRGQGTATWKTDTDGLNNGGSLIYGTIGGDIRFSTIPNTASFADQTGITDATVEGNTRLLIKNDGNVGIGTTAPYYKLHVNGKGAHGEVMSLQDSTYETIFLARAGGSSYNPMVKSRDHVIIWKRGNTTDAPTGFVIGPWSNSYKGIRIDASGKTAIGSPEHLARLDVYESVPLGSSVGNVSHIRSYRALTEGVSGNQVMDNLWLQKKRVNDGWYGTVLHNGVSVDNVFLTPGSSTRTWWERDPSEIIQSWGDEANTFMTLRASNLGIGITIPKSKLETGGSFGAKVFEATSSYIAGDETIILVKNLSANAAINLPDASNYSNRIYMIKRIDNSGFTCTIYPSGSQTIDDNGTKTLAYLNSITIVASGGNWYILD